MTERTELATVPTVRLSGPSGLAAAVPQLLGFEPTESLVLLCLRGPRGRVGPVARVDLFPPGEQAPVQQLVGCASRYADAVAVICYHSRGRPTCLDAVLTALDDAKVPISCALSIRDGLIRDGATPARFRSDPGVPAPGADDPARRELAAAGALSGRQVLRDRAALRASIAAPTGARLSQARTAIESACEALAIDLGDDPATCAPDAFAARADTAFAVAMSDYRTSGTVSLPSAAPLIVLAGDIGARDLVVARAVGCGDRDVVALLIAVAAWSPDEDAAEICAVLAVAAYRYGDGALAQCAVDRVLAIRPRHRLAHLMLAVMAACLPPDELATMANIAPAPQDGASDSYDDRDT